MIERATTSLVRSRLRNYPAVCLVGPRQCGKTTLAKSLGGEYYDLERPEDRAALDVEWPQRASAHTLTILDEAQAWPEVFPRLRAAIDDDRNRNGRFLLLGSVSPSLMRQVSESLAGRLSLVELTPFALGELTSGPARRRLWRCGGYPRGGVLSPRRYPRWQHDYLALLSARDLPNWGLAAKPATLSRLMHMLAASHGQLWNASQLGQSLGLSYHTVNNYLEWLVGAFLIRQLPPFHRNALKRLVKAPKVYWRDSGLLHALLGVTDDRQLLRQPWVGASWEGFVIEQVLRTVSALETPCEAHFLRTKEGAEVDLLLSLPSETWAIEVKLTTAPDVADLRRLSAAAALADARRSFLVSRVAETSEGQDQVSCSLEWLLDHLRSELG